MEAGELVGDKAVGAYYVMKDIRRRLK